MFDRKMFFSMQQFDSLIIFNSNSDGDLKLYEYISYEKFQQKNNVYKFINLPYVTFE